MLVRLGGIAVSDLRQLITETWLVQAPKQLVKEFLGEAAAAIGAKNG